MTKELEFEQIVKNYDILKKLAGQLGGRTDAVLKLFDHLGNRLAESPASSRTNYHNSFTGGLVAHILGVCSNALKLNEAWGQASYPLNRYRVPFLPLNNFLHTRFQ